MAQAEDVLTDAARHATDYAQQLWRRQRPARMPGVRVELGDVARRIELLLTAVFGRSFVLRTAQAPVPQGVQRQLPLQRDAIPATDGEHLWLPRQLISGDTVEIGLERFRAIALQQAMRATRGSAQAAPAAGALRELYLLLEAHAADRALAKRLPGLERSLARLRLYALQHRPAITLFPAPLRAIELTVRRVLQSPPSAQLPGLPSLKPHATPAQVLQQAQELSAQLPEALQRMEGILLWRDLWTGDLRLPQPAARLAPSTPADAEEHMRMPKGARLARRPEVRQSPEGKDEHEEKTGAWMVQTPQSPEGAADLMGLQRRIDPDETTASEDFGQALSQLPRARRIAIPGLSKEVPLSDDAPEMRRKRAAAAVPQGAQPLHYPEWDWRISGYRPAGAAVRVLPAAEGPLSWVEQTLADRAGMLHDIRRRFELLRARRQRLRRLLEGDEIDLESWIDSRADFMAGLPLTQRLYRGERRVRRDLAVTLLVDISGSTDSRIATERRVIDIEREALLLVCIALEGLCEPYCVQAFSGEGPQSVAIYDIKRFGERYGDPVARRIAGLQPQHYTRAGAALRHATATLMRQNAAHRLLLLLSDGKPKDIDEYEGRYGVEDMRQAVTEAHLQGISTFCLTIDRQAASYLPTIFGPHHYALLTQPELLPSALIDRLRRLVMA